MKKLIGISIAALLLPVLSMAQDNTATPPAGGAQPAPAAGSPEGGAPAKGKHHKMHKKMKGEKKEEKGEAKGKKEMRHHKMHKKMKGEKKEEKGEAPAGGTAQPAPAPSGAPQQ